MAKNTEAAPLLPPASVDFNALHDACVAGKEPDAARDAAVIGETLGDPVDAAAAPDSDDGLDELTKPQLQERARRFGIAFETDANKDRLKDLLREAPGGAANPDVIADAGEA